MLSVSALSVGFGAALILNEVNLEVQPGEILGISGNNGCGKTCLLDTLSGFVQPRAGEIRASEVHLEQADPYLFFQAGIGRSFQEPRIFRDLTVRENLTYTDRVRDLGLANLFLKSASRRSNCLSSRLLEQFGLTGRDAEVAGNLSFGTRKLLDIAAVLYRRPPIALFDEPTAGIDARNKLALENSLSSLAETGSALLVVDHDQSFLSRVCDRVCLIDSSKLGPLLLD